MTHQHSPRSVFQFDQSRAAVRDMARLVAEHRADSRCVGLSCISYGAGEFLRTLTWKELVEFSETCLAVMADDLNARPDPLEVALGDSLPETPEKEGDQP